MLVAGRGVRSARSRQRVIAVAQVIEFSEPALPRLLGPWVLALLPLPLQRRQLMDYSCQRCGQPPPAYPKICPQTAAGTQCRCGAKLTVHAQPKNSDDSSCIQPDHFLPAWILGAEPIQAGLNLLIGIAVKQFRTLDVGPMDN